MAVKGSVTVRITIWNEYVQERDDPAIAAVYPDGIHVAIADGLRERLPEVSVGYASLDEPEHGLGADTLDATDVLVWWGHLHHHRVDESVVARVRQRVLGGMGLILLHSGIESKVAMALLGTTCKMSWWRHDDTEVIWTVAPTHPIAANVPNPIYLEQGEMYGEPFDVPTPDDLVFITAYGGGEVLRSGCSWDVGRGRVFFLSNGHEEYPIYFRPDIRTILANAAQWVAPRREIVLPSPMVPNPELGWWRPEPSNEGSDAAASIET
jgi:trehalose utilization protein